MPPNDGSEVRQSQPVPPASITPTFDEVVEVVSRTFGVTDREIFRGSDRGRALIARQVVYVMASDVCGLTAKEVARAAHVQSRSVVTRARNAIKQRSALDSDLARRVEEVRLTLLGRPIDSAKGRFSSDEAWRTPAVEVLAAVGRHLGIPVERLRRPISTYNDARARATAMYVLATVRDESPAEIQQSVGGSKARISESIRDIKGEMARDHDYGAQVAAIVTELGGDVRHRRRALSKLDMGVPDLGNSLAADEVLNSVRRELAMTVQSKRRRRGLSVENLASHSDSSASSIQRLEDGKLCTFATLSKVAAALDCEIVVELRPRQSVVHAAKDLTLTERRLLRAYRKERSLAKAAAVLKIAIGTAGVHANSIRTKLGATSIAEALNLAIARDVLREKPSNRSRRAVSPRLPGEN